MPSSTDAPATRPAGRGRMDKRRAILDAAAEAFGELGYERASIDAIAERSGVSKPTIYSHFGTKEQLFRDSIAESAATINSESLAAILAFDADDGAWREGLNRLGVALTACHRSPCAQSLQRQVHAEITRDPAVFDAVQSRAAGPIVSALAGKLAMLGNAGVLRVADPTLAAHQLLALLGAELPERTRLGTTDVGDGEAEQMATAAVDTFLRAYAAD